MNSRVDSRGMGSQRHPHRDVLATLDVVVGLILVPRCALAGLRFLDEQMVVIEPNVFG